MGPVAERPPRAPKAPDPLRAHLLKRTTGREVWEWANHPADELMRRGEGTPPRSVTSPRPPRSYPAMVRICRPASVCTSSRSQLIRGCAVPEPAPDLPPGSSAVGLHLDRSALDFAPEHLEAEGRRSEIPSWAPRYANWANAVGRWCLAQRARVGRIAGGPPYTNPYSGQGSTRAGCGSAAAASTARSLRPTPTTPMAVAGNTGSTCADRRRPGRPQGPQHEAARVSPKGVRRRTDPNPRRAPQLCA